MVKKIAWTCFLLIFLLLYQDFGLCVVVVAVIVVVVVADDVARWLKTLTALVLTGRNLIPLKP